MTLNLGPASALDPDALTDLFNAGYAGYAVPVNVTAAYIQSHIRQQDVSLADSVIVWDDDRPVGFTYLAIRDRRGWVAGLGVVADARRRGVGRLLMDGLLDNARRAGLHSVQLEVIAGNDAAHALYERAGLHDIRRLLIIERAPAPVAASPWPGSLESGSVDDALAAYDRLHASENPWQREPPTLQKIVPPLEARLAVVEGRVAAYVIGSFSEARLSLYDVAVDPAQPDALAALLADLHGRYPQAQARLVNLDAGDPAWPVLEARGYTVQLSQHEMRIVLGNA
jgi:ribosomal protein S18 acetylase RimI-like enzyme